MLSNEEKLSRSAGDDVMGDTIFGKERFFFCALRSGLTKRVGERIW